MADITQAPAFAGTVPSVIKQLPIEYDQEINTLLDHIEYNALQARALCEVTDSLGEMTANAKEQVGTLRDAINLMIDTYSADEGHFTAGDNTGGFAIYRPYYEDWKVINMMVIVSLDFTNSSALDSATSVRADYVAAFNEFT